MAQKPDLVGTRGAARALDVHEHTVRKLVREGRLPHYRIGKIIKFNEAELLASVKRDATKDK